MTSIARRYPLVSYYVLACFLSWVVLPLLSLLLSLRQMSSLARFLNFGPGLAAILITALVNGGTGVRKLLSSLLVWRVSIQWWTVAFLLPGLIALGATYLFTLSSGSVVDLSRFSPVSSVFLVIVLLTVLTGIGEELGWRGFAMQCLQSRYNALVSSLILGLFWGLWHARNFFVAGKSIQFIYIEKLLNTMDGFLMVVHYYIIN